MSCEIIQNKILEFDISNRKFYENDDNLNFLFDMLKKYNKIKEIAFSSLIFKSGYDEYIIKIYNKIYMIKFYLYRYELWSDLDEEMKDFINILLKYFLIENKILSIIDFDPCKLIKKR